MEAMTTDDLHTRAAEALKASLRRAVADLVKDLDTGGRANMAVPALRVAGREQVALAEKIRKRAARTGWMEEKRP